MHIVSVALRWLNEEVEARKSRLVHDVGPNTSRLGFSGSTAVVAGSHEAPWPESARFENVYRRNAYRWRSVEPM